MVWMLTSRGRPEDCKRLIAAFEAVKDVPEVAVCIDDDPQVYRDVDWPDHWPLHIAPEHLEMTRAMNWLQDLHPGRKFYGMFADHFRPKTKWSEPLQAAAGDWFIAWPEDHYVSGWQVSAAPCFGGKLMKELGYICNPRSVHLGTEHPWIHLWHHIGLGRKVSEVIVTHDKSEVNGRPYDQTRQRVYKGVHYEPADGVAWQEWLRDDGDRILAAVRAGMKKDGYHFDDTGKVIMAGMTPHP